MDQMFQLAGESLKQDPYTLQDMIDEFKVEDPFKIVTDICHHWEVKTQNESFPLYKRAYHICKETKRVHEFNSICKDKNMSDEDKC